ncbi:hypothetical protein PHYC_01179 [Phycisphaerales bacterium]|nr:hypothetical protein PHYC_01179 [Phycisphaerales bacterium]
MTPSDDHCSRRRALGTFLGALAGTSALSASGCSFTLGYPSPPPSPLPSPPARPRLKPVYDCTLWMNKPGGVLPGALRAYCPGREWRSIDDVPTSAYDAARWERWLRGLPRDSVVIVDQEYLHDNPWVYGRQTVLREIEKRIELHRAIRRVRPDIQNSDCFGPCPAVEYLGTVHNLKERIPKWKEYNDFTMPLILPYLKQVAIELYFVPPPGKPVRSSYIEDFRAYLVPNVEEARRHAGDRPVLGFIYLRSKGNGKKHWGRYFGDELSRFILDESLRLCDGIVLWDRKYADDGTDLGNMPWDPNDPCLAFTLRWLRERTVPPATSPSSPASPRPLSPTGK